MGDNLKKDLKTKIQQFGKEIDEIVENVPKSGFSIEITLTEGCNWDCEYCFEGSVKETCKKHRLNEDPEPLFKTIDQVFEQEWFNENDSLKIDFWGGEPSLNLSLMKQILDRYKDDRRVSFFLYTNGSRMDKVIPLLLPLRDLPCNEKNKVLVQVSYDGNPIHDLRRLDKKGNATSDIAKKAMDLLFLNKIVFHIKSTLMPKDFCRMSEAWDDIFQLRQKYGNNINYAPTIDYYTDAYTEKNYRDLETAVLDIAFKEASLNKRRENFLLGWFARPNKAVCGSGRNMFAIDINGNVHFCHGCIYGNKLQYSNIYEDDTLFEKLERNREMLDVKVYNEECEKCVATTCIRCNYQKYLNSDKKRFTDKFFDFTSQPYLCEYYKLIGKIDRALTTIIGRKI